MAKLQSVLVVADSHHPFQSVRAWDLMLKVGQFLKPEIIIANGDIADFYSVSSHSKDPARVGKLAEELLEVNIALDELDDLGAKQKLFVAGNHCDRLTRYLQDKCPELFGVVSIPELFRLKERGWSYTPYKQYTKLGKMHITHDVGTAGRFAAYKALDTFGHSVITGHTHRMSYVVEGNAVGEYKLSAQFGWLGDATKVDYMARVNVNKNWALGFGIGHINPATGVVYLTPVPIVVVKGAFTCVAQGKYFEN